jgi:hypothetical protein
MDSDIYFQFLGHLLIWMNRSRLMAYISVYLYVFNSWMPETFFMKCGVYNMAPEPFSRES